MKIVNKKEVIKNRQGEYWTNVLNETEWFQLTDEFTRKLVYDLVHLYKLSSLDEETVGGMIEKRMELIKQQYELTHPIEITENQNIYKENHLVRYLKDTKQKLTQKEFDCLQAILGQGSFYEESANYNEKTKEYYVAPDYPTFIGWEITEEEVKGCRGALASLVKKGILEISSDNVNGEELATYYIKYTPDFKKDSEYYHELDIPTEFIR